MLIYRCIEGYSNRIIVLRSFVLFTGLFFGFFFSEFLNPHEETFSGQQTYSQMDRGAWLLESSKDPELMQKALAQEVSEKILSEHFTTLDFMQYGKIMANALQDEISFQNYYIAYLKAPDKMETNSDLKFSTYI